MKAIVANVLFSGIFCCFSISNPVLANTSVEAKRTDIPPVLSARALRQERLPILPLISDFVDWVFILDRPQHIGILVDPDSQILFDAKLSSNLNFTDSKTLSLEKRPYTHQGDGGNLILGFQNTFWPSESPQKYWGLTAIEHWGENSSNDLALPNLNYTNRAPTLPSGSSALTVSGGGNQNLVNDDSSADFEEFRGGVAFHRGISENVTMGVGFIYEDLLVGFSQLTYESDLLPLRTTVSFLTGESGLEVHSHLRFKPVDNFVLNYYNKREEQKFDLNWQVLSGLTLLAKGNSQKESLSTGLKISMQNEYLSLSAKVELDNSNNWQWDFNTQLGRLQIVYASRPKESNSELNFNMLQIEPLGFHCSAFVTYETREIKEDREDLTVWGGRLHFGEKANGQKYRWAFDLGYGAGSQGSGAIASTSVVLQPNLSLKLTYQEVSTVSDDTKIKLQLSSK